MTRPAPLENGDCAHLTPGTVRDSVARAMRLVAAVTAEAMGAAPEQYARLLEGRDVELDRADVLAYVPSNRWPTRLDHYATWIVRGDDELLPRTTKRRARP